MTNGNDKPWTRPAGGFSARHDGVVNQTFMPS